MKARTKRISSVLALLLVLAALLGAGALFLQVHYGDTFRSSYGMTADRYRYVDTSWAKLVTPSRWIHLAGPTDPYKGTHGHFLTRHGLIYYGYCLFDDWSVMESEDGHLVALSLGDQYHIAIIKDRYRYYVATRHDGRLAGVQVPIQHNMKRPLTLYPSRALANYIGDMSEVLDRSRFHEDFLNFAASTNQPD